MIENFLIFLILVSGFNVKSAKILGIFPIPSISHQVVFRTLTLELAKRGHELTVITTDPVYGNREAPSNYREIDVHDISYEVLRKAFQSNYNIDQKLSIATETIQTYSIATNILEVQLKSPQVQDLILNKTNNFDLLLLEAVSSASIVFSHLFKAPVILVSSLGAMFNNHEIIGSATHPLLYPSFLSRRVYNLNIWEKIYELYRYLSLKYAFNVLQNYDSKQMQGILGDDIPHLSELSNNIDMLFLNIPPIWANNQPVPPNVLYMGGIHQQPPKEVPRDLKAYLDASKNGVIYLSFGTNVVPKMIPQDKIDAMVRALSSLPYDVLWKWNHDDLPGKGDNIRLSKWFPQADLLKHPNIKVFITQAGIQSTDEAITAGVPLVAIPILSDQWYNAEKYVHLGIGVQVEIKTLTEDVFKNSVQTVIESESYRQNVIRVRGVVTDTPQSPLERAVWWTEYVIRHRGAKHLKPPAANMSFIEYYEVKLLSIVLSALVGVLTFLIKLLAYIYRLLRRLISNESKTKTH